MDSSTNGYNARIMRLEQSLSETAASLATNSSQIGQVVTAIEKMECVLGGKLDEVVRASTSQEHRLTKLEDLASKAQGRTEFWGTRVFLPLGLIFFGVFAREIGGMLWLIVG